MWYCFPVLKEYIINELNADVFLHTWEIDNGGQTPCDDAAKSCSIEEKKEYIENRIKPKRYVIENYNDFLQKYPSQTHPSTAPMYYSIMKSNALKKEYELENNFKYDVVFRIRMDVMFDTTIDKEELKNVIEQKKLYIGYHSVDKIESQPKISDFFAFSTSENMDYYSDAFKLWENNRYLNGEDVLNTHILNANLKYKWTNTKMKLTYRWQTCRAYFAYAYRQNFAYQD